MHVPARSIIASLSLVFVSTATAAENWAVWSQPQNSTYAIVPSYASADPPSDIEVADDFDLTGTVERIVVSGYDCFNCATPTVAGAYVRFYQWTATGPGALQAETFIPGGSSALVTSALYPATLDITLPEPFNATGKHFMSVQLALAGSGSWDWWITNHNAPLGVAAMTRDRQAGPDAPWSPIESVLGPLNSDVSFLLWGNDGNPPPPGSDPCGDWTVVPTPSPSGTDHAILRDLHVISSTDVWAVGEYTAQVNGSYQTFSMALHHDGGAWSIIPSPNPTACSSCTYVTFDAVAAAGPNDVWAAGGKRVQAPDGFLGTHIFVARYDGSSWTVMNTPLTVGGSGAHVQGIEIVAPNDIWFFGEFIDTSGGPGGSQPALAMHWNGSAFTVVPTPYPAGGTPGWGLEAGSSLGPNDIWAVGGGSDGDDSATGYVIHWDGSAWTRIPSPSPGNFQRLYDVKALAPNDVWAVGSYFDVNIGYLPLFIHWDGSSWTQVPSPGGGSSLVAFAPDHIYSGGAGIVHWDGESWEQVEAFDSVIGPSVTAISPVGLCDIWAAGRQIVAGDILNFSAHLQTGPVGDFAFMGDVSGDMKVDIDDLFMVINAWGDCPAQGGCAADITGDGKVDVDDLFMVINHWG